MSFFDIGDSPVAARSAAPIARREAILPRDSSARRSASQAITQAAMGIDDAKFRRQRAVAAN